ncbi:type II toxin-antitoxin system Phd/YefM family antitoxin [Deinococcus yunweiensis]|uniref:type II toxin-antitoxin system Phd/YefM family antitoxin n=1 Tax=Deinococcus yunweiensis TaxID=367282 RepID=UPI00398F6754
MTRIWKLEDAKANLSQLIRAAEQEPQVITRHGRPVAVVNAASTSDTPVADPVAPRRSAWQALRGDFDFRDMPDDDWLQPDRAGSLRADPFGAEE